MGSYITFYFFLLQTMLQEVEILAYWLCISTAIDISKLLSQIFLLYYSPPAMYETFNCSMYLSELISSPFLNYSEWYKLVFNLLLACISSKLSELFTSFLSFGFLNSINELFFYFVHLSIV